jgi:hypothetical protein
MAILVLSHITQYTGVLDKMQEVCIQSLFMPCVYIYWILLLSIRGN